MLQFINTNCKRILKSSQSAHVKDLMMFDDFIIDYDTTNDVFHPMSTTTISLGDRLISKRCRFEYGPGSLMRNMQQFFSMRA